ncbi:MAG: hypothetical protein ACPGWR_02345 [Ardenticatenaceae bacterium]
MPEVILRRIKLKNKDQYHKAQVFTIAPSFVMPYMTGYSDSVEDALFLHSKFGVPYWALSQVFGRNDMYWYRLMKSFSCNSIVGTTIKHIDKLSKNILAYEKHSKINGTKAYIATIAGNDCILGASISEKADTKGLVEAYGHFVSEVNQIDSSYTVQSVNTDGWSATVSAWKQLYPEVVTVRCFLHAFIKIRSCAKKHTNFEQLREQVWEIYHQEDKESFLSKISELKKWAGQNLSGSAQR